MKRLTSLVVVSTKLGLLLGLAITTASLGIAAQSDVLPRAGLPLGRAELPELRTTHVVRPGVTHVHVQRGYRGPEAHWALVTKKHMTAKSEVSEMRSRLEQAGLGVRAHWYQEPQAGTAFCVLYAGAFSSKAEASDALSKRDDKDELAVAHDASRVHWATGPWALDIVVIDPAQYRGRIVSGREVGLAITSEIAREHNASIAVNAGFFHGYVRPGESPTIVPHSTGASIIRGEWFNEPDVGPVLLVENTEAGPKMWIEQPLLSIPRPVVKWSSGRTAQLTGINRPPKLANELIALRPDVLEYWRELGIEAVEMLMLRVDNEGRLSRLTAEQALGSEDLALVGVGRWKDKLEASLKARERVEFSLQLAGRPGLSAFRGVPILIQGGEPVSGDWRQPRRPRTAIGSDAAGRIYVVTVDGDQYDEPADGSPGSIGATLSEVREVMRYLGTVDAINLDGGGSTVMVIEGEVASRPYAPSAPEGKHLVERRILDALLLID